MPRLFLSAAPADWPVAQQLQHALTVRGMTVWHEQAPYEGGRPWPTVIAEALAAQDILILVWSKHAAPWPPMELAWTLAVVWQKIIVPCGLDATPLPPALGVLNAIDLSALEAALPNILHALQRPISPGSAARRTRVLAYLAALTLPHPEDVVRAVQTFCRQQGWYG